jgi:hypothetical protein
MRVESAQRESPGDREIGPGRSLTSRLFDQASGDVFREAEEGFIGLAGTSRSPGSFAPRGSMSNRIKS